MASSVAHHLVAHRGGVRALWAAPLPAGAVAIAWLGQAGFAIRAGAHRLLIDGYLSDHLARKYKGTLFPHVRMMRAPIEPGELTGLSLVLCTHRHSDHMDPGSLPILAEVNRACRFIVPRAETDAAQGAGIPADRMMPMNAGESIAPLGEITIHAIPAAHETLKLNADGQHHCLGYILDLAGMRIYHSGDCVPYAGLSEILRQHGVHLALLPANGRDARRTAHGILGNMTFEESIQICRDAGISLLMPHHFGMFDFNTVDPRDLAERAQSLGPNLQCIIPAADRYYQLAAV